MMPIEKTKNYTRYRIRDPKKFVKSSFRTLDIGRPKKHMLVRAKLKKTGKWATQSVMVEKGAWDRWTKKIIDKAKMENVI